MEIGHQKAIGYLPFKPQGSTWAGYSGCGPHLYALHLQHSTPLIFIWWCKEVRKWDPQPSYQYKITNSDDSWDDTIKYEWVSKWVKLLICDPMDCSPPGFWVHGILQARILEWVAVSFSRGSSQPRIQPGSPVLLADTLTSEPPGKPYN